MEHSQNNAKDIAHSSTSPNIPMAPNCHEAEVEHSQDEEISSLDISAFVAMLSEVEAANPQDSSSAEHREQGEISRREASRKEVHSQGVLRQLQKEESECWSSSSAPVPGSNAHTSSSPDNKQQAPAGTVSWKDIEQYSLELDADGSGVRIERIDLSCVEEEDPKSLHLSPKTQAELKNLESTDSEAPSPSRDFQSTAQAFSRVLVGTKTTRQFHMPMGGDIIGAAAKPVPFYNPPAYRPTPAQAGLVSQASGRWPALLQQQKVEIQPVITQSTPRLAVIEQIPEGGVAKEAQRDLDDAFHELNSGSTRSSSMVVPGATAVRRAAAKPAGTKGFLGSIKSKCGDLFSPSKKSKRQT